MKKILYILLALLLNSNSFSQILDNNLIVEGKGMIKIQPELIRFTIDFKSVDTDYEKCVEKSFSLIQKAKSLLIKHDIPESELKVISLDVNKKHKYNSQTKENEFIGYTASSKLTIEGNINDLKIDIIFDILNKDFKSNYGVLYELSDQQNADAKDQLIKLASLDAKEKAKSICNEMDITIGRIVKIQYGEPTTIDRFMKQESDFLYKSSYKVLLRGGRAIRTSLTPQSIALKTNIVIAWQIDS